MSTRALPTLAVTLCVALDLLPSQAFADALPPPVPLKCPLGTTLVNDHGGTQCVADAPTNCPSGWRGVRGGQCILDVCVEDASCRGGAKCMAADLCASEGMGSSYGAIVRGPWLAAPPSPQWMISYSDVCSEQRTCGRATKCVAAKVCLPAGATRPAPRPASGGVYKMSKTRPANASESDALEPEPPTTVVTPTTVPSSSTPESPPRNVASAPPGGGGCAGCTMTTTGLPWRSSLFGVALGTLGFALAFARRRR